MGQNIDNMNSENWHPLIATEYWAYHQPYQSQQVHAGENKDQYSLLSHVLARLYKAQRTMLEKLLVDKRQTIQINMPHTEPHNTLSGLRCRIHNQDTELTIFKPSCNH